MSAITDTSCHKRGILLGIHDGVTVLGPIQRPEFGHT